MEGYLYAVHPSIYTCNKLIVLPVAFWYQFLLYILLYFEKFV